MNPLVFTLFAIGFFFINAIRRSPAVCILAFSYIFGALSFTVDILEQAGIKLMGAIPGASLYAITAVLFSGSLTLHYRGWSPWLFFSAIFAGHMALYVWVRMAFGQSWITAFEANFGCGVIFWLGVFLIRNHVPRTIDKAVFWLLVVGAAQGFIRPLLVAYLSGGASQDTWNFPMFLLVMHFVVGACAILLGMALLVAFSSEIVQDLEKRSVTDRLSGLLNRRGFEDEANSVFSMRDADNKFVTVILTDIDNFKTVNDTRGHAVGDMVIAEMGALLFQYSDRSRFAGRIGGEEFALMLVGEPLQSARELAEAIRKDFSKLRVDNGDAAGTAMSFTASFGVAMRQKGESFLSLLSRADEALYLAKANGRNQVLCETDVMVHRLHEINSVRPRHEGRRFRGALPASGGAE